MNMNPAPTCLDPRGGVVVRLTRAFLPLLQQAPAAQIVNLSSVFGIIAPPGQTAYCAAKFAVRGFSESLRHELEASRSSVRLTVVHPGGVRTGIALGATPVPRDLLEVGGARPRPPGHPHHLNHSPVPPP